MTVHPRALLPGYVLEDLDGAEVSLVEAHLLGCLACQAEVDRLRDALFSLADDLPEAALPVDTWNRIQARRTFNAPTIGPQPIGLRQPVSVPLRLQRPRWLWLAAAAVAVLALGTVATRLATVPSPQATVRQWEVQGASRLTFTSRDGQAFGTLLIRSDGQALVVLTAPAPDGQIYQAWGRRGSGTGAGVPVSLGITGGTIMQVGWQGYASVGISVEPAGGSPAPTHPLGRVALPGV